MYLSKLIAGLILVLICNTVYAKALPDKLTIAILLKVVNYSQQISKKNQVKLHVVSNEAMADKIKAYLADVDKSKRVSVSESNTVPEGQVDIVFVASASKVGDVVKYTRKHQAMSVTNNVAVSGEGVSLIIFDDEGVPGILINTMSSKYESLSWDPEILEIAKILESVE